MLAQCRLKPWGFLKASQERGSQGLSTVPMSTSPFQRRKVTQHGRDSPYHTPDGDGIQVGAQDSLGPVQLPKPGQGGRKIHLCPLPSTRGAQLRSDRLIPVQARFSIPQHSGFSGAGERSQPQVKGRQGIRSSGGRHGSVGPPKCSPVFQNLVCSSVPSDKASTVALCPRVKGKPRALDHRVRSLSWVGKGEKRPGGGSGQ